MFRSGGFVGFNKPEFLELNNDFDELICCLLCADWFDALLEIGIEHPFLRLFIED
jgi:hypothetical protein